MLTIRWIDDNGEPRVLDISLNRFFIGRLHREDSPLAFSDNEAARKWGIYVFNPEEKYSKYLNVIDGFVSRRHLLVTIDKGVVKVRDHGPNGAGSKNGTYINGRIVPRGKESIVSIGSRVKLGPYFEFTIIGVKEKRIPVTISIGEVVVESKEVIEELMEMGVKVNYEDIGRNKVVAIINEAPQRYVRVKEMEYDIKPKDLISVLNYRLNDLLRVKEYIEKEFSEELLLRELLALNVGLISFKEHYLNKLNISEKIRESIKNDIIRLGTFIERVKGGEREYLNQIKRHIDFIIGYLYGIIRNLQALNP